MTSTADPAKTPGSTAERQRLARLLADRERAPRLYPLSSSQQRLWFLDRLEGTRGYSLHQALRLRGDLVLRGLEGAVVGLLRRHGALRTVIVEADGEPYQAVLPAETFEGARRVFFRVDLEAAREAAPGLLEKVLRKPFSLARGPLFRVLLLALGGEEHILLIHLHHIVADGASMQILAQDLAELYRAEIGGEAPRLEPLESDYGAYSRWQQRRLAGTEAERLVRFWRRTLEGAPPQLELPTDKPRPAKLSGAGDLLPFHVRPELLAAMEGRARQEGCTPFQVWMTAFLAFLLRLTDRRDLVVGIPVGGRTRSQLEGLVGFFINTLVLRCRVSPGDSFLDTLRRVVERSVEAFDHQELPFDRLVEAVQPPRDARFAPVVQVSFQVQSLPVEVPALVGLETERIELDPGTATLDLAVYLEGSGASSGSGSQGYVQSHRDLFDPGTVERWSRQFLTLADGAARRPATTLEALSLFGAAEIDQLRGEASPSPSTLGPSAPQGILQRIYAWVEEAPGAPALLFGGETWSYEELWRRSGEIATALAGHGVGVEDPVGVLSDRSPQQVAALLGILRRGAVYLPLDSSLPRDRLHFSLEDAGANIVVSDQEGCSRLASLEAFKAGALAILDWEEISEGAEIPRGETAGAERAHPSSGAYLIYTSGTTGRPKGVLVGRRALEDHCRAVAELYEISAGEGVLAFASVGFDTSLEQILPALTCGARVVLRPREMWGAAELWAEVTEKRIAVANLSTAYWKEMISQGAEEGRDLGGSSLRLLIVGGEAMTTGALAAWHRWVGADAPKLLNAYGPTEATVTATVGVTKSAPTARQISIGRPLVGRSAWVVDRRLGPVAERALGELALGGCLARGYVGLPASTAACFVPDPWALKAGERLYLTGDLARRRLDSTLEILGRRDRQLKLRGFRIEPAEIEAVLLGDGSVEQAAVVAKLRPGTPGAGAASGSEDRQLVAYVVAREAAEVPRLEEVLLERLSDRLPPYMVPTRVMLLERLPLTLNGKLDTRALPNPTEAPSKVPEPGVSRPLGRPTDSPLGELAMESWRHHLGVEKVRPEDDFFSLGGHSLLATRLVSTLGRSLGLEIPVAEIFDRPRFSDFVQRLGKLHRELHRQLHREFHRGGGSAAAAIQPVESPTHAFPLSFSQERLWFLDRLTPDSTLYNIAGRLRLRGDLDPSALGKSLALIEARHGSLRTVFHRRRGGPRQRVQPGRQDVLQRIDLAGLGARAEAAAARLADVAARRPFRLDRGPLWRAHLLKLGEGRHDLVVVLHHIVSDGWSQGVFFAELAHAYGAFSRGTQPRLAPLELQYSDYSVWQRDYLEGEVLDGLLRFWRSRLASAMADDSSGKRPEVAHLPTDRPRPVRQSFRGSLLRYRFSRSPGEPSLEEGLRHLGRRRGATLFMVLLAAFQALLYRLSGGREILLGTPVANRDRPEVADLIGFFVNTLVLRTTVQPNASFAEWVVTQRRAVLEAYAHQDLPFERLVGELAPHRDLGQAPLFQIMLTLQEGEMQVPSLEGLEASLDPLDSGTAKFDLSIYFRCAGEGLEAGFEYDRDLFDGTSVQRLAGQLEVLLRNALEDPDGALRGLALLTAAEAQQLRAEWNDSVRPFSPVMTLHGRVEAQVDRTPAATAVEMAEGEGRLTYAELDERANRLAHHLGRQGVAPEVRVGVLLERSLDLVVALVAVLKAGGAYIPLDPDYPEERLAFMARDARLGALISVEGLVAKLSGEGVGPSRTVLLDRDARSIGTSPRHRPTPSLGPENLAYIIYTSGSTGRPKGAMNSHRGIFNRLRWMQEAYGLGPEDKVLQKTPFSFDVSVWEFFWPLATGATLVMARPGGHGDPRYLAQTIQDCGITTLHFVPSMLQAFLTVPEARGCTGLRRIIASGEALARPLVERCHEVLAAQLHNLYGPTEAAVDVTSWPCRRGETGSVVIGRPIANTLVAVLDGDLNPVPVGAPGQLFLGGENLGRGYWGRGARTAEAFLPLPTGLAAEESPGQRLYATGDRVRWRIDGALEFLGRIDFQVKIRGQRIELGEVEAALLKLPKIRQAVAMVEEGPRGDAQVAAFLGGPGPALPDLWRQQLRRSLPEAMIPTRFVLRETLSLTPNGKVDRRALEALAEAPTDEPDLRSEREGSSRRNRPSGLEGQIADLWKRVLGRRHIPLDTSFFDLGGHSLLLVEVQTRLSEDLGHPVELVDLFQYPTVRELTRFLDPTVENAPVQQVQPRPPREDTEERSIAIVAMSGRFPGADSMEELWENLRAGKESISFFEDDELEISPFAPVNPKDPSFVGAGGVVEGADLFDAEVFEITPREAEILDPQQRVFLECSWQALERAGYDPRRYPHRIGVYAGMGIGSYLYTHVLASPKTLAATGGYAATLANDKDFLATRVAYKLGLKGPVVTVQSACSTSLVAVHLACRALRAGECELALAGGVTIRTPQKTGYLYQPSMILSPDGRCRPFDASAAGTVGGNGAGVVVLKRLSQALQDRDPIVAVIRGSAVNNDGSRKVGFTAPGVEGQRQVIVEALADARVEAASLSLIEAHGTGTELGDPIEVAALSQAFQDVEGRGSCALTSVKANLGHLDAAAGVAGLVKAALALEHRYLPPMAAFRAPNPHLDLASTPFFVPREGRPWENEGPLRAGVSSFGIGGTNAHVVLEEAPEAVLSASATSRQAQLLLLSAASKEALDAMSDNLAGALQGAQGADAEEGFLADTAFTLQFGRRRLPHRQAWVVRDLKGSVEALVSKKGRRGSLEEELEGRPVAFLFPGQGAQAAGMGAELYRREETYRQAVDLCCEALETPLKMDLRTLLLASPEDAEAAKALLRTQFAQPALFTVEYALAQLWMEWVGPPQALLGHSIGEYVAACIAGTLSLNDALRLVAARGRLMQTLPAGGMLSLPLSEEELEEALAAGPHLPGLELAAVNGPRSTVVSGPYPALDALEESLREAGHESRRLETSHAFHSAMMEPILEDFRGEVSRLSLAPPEIPFVSNLSARWIRDEEATDPEYWVRHLRHTVRFSEGLERLLDEGAPALVEVGPGRTLSALVRRRERRWPMVVSLPGGKRRGEEVETLLEGLGALWKAGVDIRWEGFYRREDRRRVVLPTYPFERRKYLVEPSQASAAGREDRLPASLEESFFVPSWRRRPAVEEAATAQDTAWLLVRSPGGLAEQIAELLEARLEARGASVWSSEPRRRAGWEEYFRTIPSTPRRLLFLDPVEGVRGGLLEPDAFASNQERALYPFLELSQALAQGPGRLDAPVELFVLTTGLVQLDQRDAVEPHLSPLLGLAKVLQQEHPAVACRCIDVEIPLPRTLEATTGLVLRELHAAPRDGVLIAFRGGERWVEGVEPTVLPPAAEREPLLPPGKVVLITGGLGGLGLTLAEALGTTAKARLVLVGRSAFPPREGWSRWLADHGLEDATSKKIRRLRILEERGVEVLLEAADIADREALELLVRKVELSLGPIDGVIHAAGVVGERAAVPFLSLDRRHLEEQFQAKVYGLQALAQVFEARSPRFMMVTSSTAALLGGLYFGAYAAANLFSDTFARRQGRGGGGWVAVDWDGLQLDDTPGTVASMPLALDRKTVGEAVLRLLNLDATRIPAQVAVSPRWLPAEMARWLEIGALRERSARPTSSPRPRDEEGFEAPRGEAEERLAAIWEEVLGIAPVGREDDFFDLGGHSLLATQLLARIRDGLGHELDLSDVFEHPTVAALAQILQGGQGSRQRPPLVSVDRRRPMPLSFAQERMWLLYRFDPKGIAYNLPAAIRLRGPLKVEALRRAYGEVARRHEILRSRFFEVDGVPVQEVLEAGEYQLPKVDLRWLGASEREAEVLRLGRFAGQKPFRLEQGEVFRNLLLILGDEDHAFVSACHHMVTDGWSGGLSIHEIAVLYPAFAEGLPSPLEEPAFQYGDFAHWQRDWLKGEVLEGLVEAWRHRLTPLPPPLELPSDRPRRRGKAAAGRTQFSVPSDVLGGLRALGSSEEASLFMLSMAVFVVFLHRYTGAKDLAVGTPVANRHLPGTEGLLGVFINTLVLRTAPHGECSFRKFLSRIKEVSLEAFRHQDMPFDKLVETLRPERDAAGQTLFRALLAFNHEPPGSPALPGLELEILDLGEREDEAMFDLSVGLTDEGDHLSGSVQFNQALFDPTTARRWMGNLRRLFGSAAQFPDTPLARLDLLGAGERHQVTVEGGLLTSGQQQRLRGLWPADGKDLDERYCVVDEALSPRPLGARGQLAVIEALTYDPASRICRKAQLDLRGRLLAQGRLSLAKTPTTQESAPASVAGEAVATEKTWEEIEDRKARLSRRQQDLLARRLAGKKKQPPADPDRALVRIRPEGNQPPIFFVHAIGGDVTYYLDLAQGLGRDQPFFGIQAPGLGGELMPFESLEEMAEKYVEVLRRTQAEGPYVLGGWSMGAVVSYEMAQQLRRQEQEVKLLLLLEPSIPTAIQGFPPGQALSALARDLECLVGAPLVAEKAVPGGSHRKQVEALLHQARTAGLEVPAMEGDLSDRVLSVYENNLAVLQAYRPKAYAGNVIMVAVRDSDGTSQGSALYWRDLVGPGLDIYRVSGDHTTMLKPPHVQELAAILRFCLTRSEIR